MSSCFRECVMLFWSEGAERRNAGCEPAAWSGSRWAGLSSVRACVRLSARLFVCPSVLLSRGLSARLSFCPSVRLSFCYSVHLAVSICPSALLSVFLSAPRSFCPAVRLSACPFVLLVFLSVSPSVRLSFCPSVFCFLSLLVILLELLEQRKAFGDSRDLPQAPYVGSVRKVA